MTNTRATKLGDAGKFLGTLAAVGLLCAFALYGYASGQLKNWPAHIPSNNSTTALIGEPQ